MSNFKNKAARQDAILRQELMELIGEIGGDPVTWATITGKPAVIAAGATQAEARTAIGAGTSSLALGTTGTTAAAGNHNHAITADAASGLAAAANLQAAFVAMAARVKALEDRVTALETP